MSAASLSLVVISKNEQTDLADCLAGVEGLVDEMILLDSGSTDETCSIARSLGAKVYINTDWQGFGRQRQRAQAYASSDYILFLDPDERISARLRDSIAAVLQTPLDPNTVYAMKRTNYFCNVPVHRLGGYYDKLIRLYPRRYYAFSDAQVHESVCTAGARQITLKGSLDHYTCRTVAVFLQKQVRYGRDWASEQYALGKKSTLIKCLFKAKASFLREYLIRRAFLGGGYGLILALASAYYTFNKYLMLWSLSAAGGGARQTP